MEKKFQIVELDKNQAEKYANDIARLYVLAEWNTPETPIEQISQSLKNSFCAFAAYQDGEMVGYFRALSDGVADAYLLDLFVEPTFRRQGIAYALTEAIVCKLKDCNIEWITAISTPEAKKLYLKLGAEMDLHTPIRFFI